MGELCRLGARSHVEARFGKAASAAWRLTPRKAEAEGLSGGEARPARRRKGGRGHRPGPAPALLRIEPAQHQSPLLLRAAHHDLFADQAGPQESDRARDGKQARSGDLHERHGRPPRLLLKMQFWRQTIQAQFPGVSGLEAVQRRHRWRSGYLFAAGHVGVHSSFTHLFTAEARRRGECRGGKWASPRLGGEKASSPGVRTATAPPSKLAGGGRVREPATGGALWLRSGGSARG